MLFLLTTFCQHPVLQAFQKFKIQKSHINHSFFLLRTVRPKIRVYDQLIGVEPGLSVVMECYIESSPRPLTSWLRQDNLFLLPSAKYEINEEVSFF